MIKYREPLSMTESLEYIGDSGENEIEVKKFVKKFVKLKPAEAKKMREKLAALGLLKLKAENISNIIDILPEDQEGLNKIFTDMSLDEDETKKILETIEEFR